MSIPVSVTTKGGAADDSLLVGSVANTREKKIPKHLWHAALALILERGRPGYQYVIVHLSPQCVLISCGRSGRVVVTSSPLYQPMDAIERLGYELRVFIRVPDFGIHHPFLIGTSF